MFERIFTYSCNVLCVLLYPSSWFRVGMLRPKKGVLDIKCELAIINEDPQDTCNGKVRKTQKR
jgi:hypothetical protein